MSTITEQTEYMKKAMELAQKASWTQSTGLVEFNLERPAKFLVPVLTPLRNKIARVKTTGGTQANWRAITSLDTSNFEAVVSEGNRGAEITPQVTNYAASFVGIGLDSSFTFEAEYAAEGFDDVRARNSEQLLKQTMIKEEAYILGGLGTYGLGTTPTPVATLAGTAPAPGTLLDATAYTLYCVALSLAGFSRSTIAGGLPGQLSKTNADGSVDTMGGGNARVSAVSNTVTTSAAANHLTVTGTVSAVAGASGYAWYIGTSASTAALAQITTTNTVTIAAVPAGTQKANDAKLGTDFSANALVFDGLLSQAAKSGSNAYLKSLDGATLTSDGAGGIIEIDAALKAQWDQNRLSPTVIYVSSQEALNINKKIINSGGAPLFRFNENGGGQVLTAGSVVGNYLNKFSMGAGQVIPIQLHPNVPAGTILMVTEELPYPVSNVDNVIQMKLRKDYFMQEWPVVSRKRGFGVYFDGVLQHYAPFSLCVISNIGNG
jgi:hypothetical protein